VCFKGRACSEAEEEKEEEEAAINAEAEVDGVRAASGIDINETVDLSELGFHVDEMGVLHNLP
jgi:hypothetical protein